MKINQQFLLLGMAMSLVALPITNAAAHEGQEGKRDGKHWEEKIAKVHQELGLTPEQEAQLKATREKGHTQKEALQQQIKSKYGELQAELQKPDYSADKVKQIHSELKALKDQKEDIQLEGILEVRKVLSPEQYTKFQEMKKGWGHKHHRGHRDGMKGDEANEKSTPVSVNGTVAK
jgi:Spy/CpxP family protein refolding chaperone